MYSNWLANTTVVCATIAAVLISVLLHYEGLILTWRRLSERHATASRVKVLYGIGAVIVLHTLEIWVFGLTYWLLLRWPECGTLGGQGTLHLFDMVYFSATSFSTLGFGDLAPVGPIRFVAGTESVVGLLLITWSASFTYLEMERFWRRA